MSCARYGWASILLVLGRLRLVLGRWRRRHRGGPPGRRTQLATAREAPGPPGASSPVKAVAPPPMTTAAPRSLAEARVASGHADHHAQRADRDGLHGKPQRERGYLHGQMADRGDERGR